MTVPPNINHTNTPITIKGNLKPPMVYSRPPNAGPAMSPKPAANDIIPTKKETLSGYRTHIIDKIAVLETAAPTAVTVRNKNEDKTNIHSS